MDIGKLSTAMSMNNLQSDWGVSMLAKTMDQSRTQGADLVQMMDAASIKQMELSVNPTLGSNFDMSV